MGLTCCCILCISRPARSDDVVCGHAFDLFCDVVFVVKFPLYAGGRAVRFRYDRSDLTVRRVIQDVQFITAMNPRAGSFNINPRLQRHFSLICIEMPQDSDLDLIYRQILNDHFLHGPEKFVAAVTDKIGDVVEATISLYRKVSTVFIPSVVHFHYNFNLREFSAIAEGLCRLAPEQCTSELQLGRLWLHECARVFGDRLSSEHDVKRFTSMLHHHCVGAFPNCEDRKITREPLIFTPFGGVSGKVSAHRRNGAAAGGRIADVPTDDRDEDAGGEDGTTEGADGLRADLDDVDVHGYYEVETRAHLQHVLDAFLDAYNDRLPQMRLVLFSQAAQHVARIARILSSPHGGNALLIGVGGSGKQSLCRLAAFICGYSVTVLPPTGGSTSMVDFTEQLKKLYVCCVAAWSSACPACLLARCWCAHRAISSEHAAPLAMRTAMMQCAHPSIHLSARW